MLTLKEKYSRLYLHSSLCLDGVVCSGSRSQQSSLTPLVERTESSSSISERKEVGILTTLDANYLSHTKCMQCLL